MARPSWISARVAVLVVALAAVVAVSQTPATPAGACSCMDFTTESALASGAAAFVGAARAEHGDAPRGWSFDVEQVVKGELPDQVEVWQDGGGECGPSFEIGERVGVVVRRDGDRYVTDDCGGVWLADELLSPGAVAAPTGHGPVALIAAGRSGPAMLASYDVDGNLAAWALDDRADDLSNLRLCPGSTTFIGIAFAEQPRLVRRDVATLAAVNSVQLPERSPDSWPELISPRAIHCTTPDGGAVLLVSASGYGDGGTDNVVVWVHSDVAVTYPIDHGWDLAPTADGQAAIMLTGEHGTDVERIVLADGNRQLLTRLPDGLGGRLIAADAGTGQLAVIATSNPTLHARGDPAAPDDRLVVLDADGSTHGVVSLNGPRLAESIRWLDAEHLSIVWALPTALVETVTLDGTVQWATPVEASVATALDGGRVYGATESGVVEYSQDGGDGRLLTPGIARVRDVLAVPDGPLAAPQPVPPLPGAAPASPTASTTPPTTTAPPSTTRQSGPAPATMSIDRIGSASPRADDGPDSTTVVMIAVLVAIAGAAAIVWLRRRQVAR